MKDCPTCKKETLPETLQDILDEIKKLGMKPSDFRIMYQSTAHVNTCYFAPSSVEVSGYHKVVYLRADDRMPLREAVSRL